MSKTIKTLEDRIRDKSIEVAKERKRQFVEHVRAAMRSLDPSGEYGYSNPLYSERAKTLMGMLLNCDSVQSFEKWPEHLVLDEIERQRDALLKAVENVEDLMCRVNGLGG